MFKFVAILAVSGGVFLTACGQSGALQLTSDPNYDQRANYLLYSTPLQKKSNADESLTEQSSKQAQ